MSGLGFEPGLDAAATQSVTQTQTPSPSEGDAAAFRQAEQEVAQADGDPAPQNGPIKAEDPSDQKLYNKAWELQQQAEAPPPAQTGPIQAEHPSDQKFYNMAWEIAQQTNGATGLTDVDGNVPAVSPPAATPNPTGPVIGLSEADFQRAADQLGVDVATVKAVAEVEAAGDGFLPSGDPKILFEAHQFGRLTGDIYNQSHPNISSANWDRTLYQGGQAEHDRLAEASALDANAAIQSASWGRFQIMGFNHQAAGYDTPEAFVDAMRQSEGNQLDAFINFIEADPAMHRALQNQDWAGFAYRYNGEGYAANQYDVKLADAYARHSGG